MWCGLSMFALDRRFAAWWLIRIGCRVSSSSLMAKFGYGGKEIAASSCGASIRISRIAAADDARGISMLAFSPDGRYLAAGGFEKRIWLYDGTTGQLVRVLDAPGADMRAVVFSPDGSQLAAAGRAGRIRMWQVADGRLLGDLDAGDRRRIHALAFSPDGSQLAAGGEAPSVRLWDTASQKLAGTLPARPGRVMSLAFCGPTTLAAGGSDNIIRIWNLATTASNTNWSATGPSRAGPGCSPRCCFPGVSLPCARC